MQRLGRRLLRSEIQFRKDQDWLSLQRLFCLYSYEKGLFQSNKMLRKSCFRTIPGQPRVSFSLPPKDPKDVDGMAKGQESEDVGRRLDIEGCCLKHFGFVFMFVHHVRALSAETRVELESQKMVCGCSLSNPGSRRAASALNRWGTFPALLLMFKK